LRQTIESGKEQIDRPAKITHRDGRTIPISISTAVLRDAEGVLLGGAETFRDLSAIEQLRREIQLQYSFEDIVSKSAALQKTFAILPDIAESDAAVLIEGPSGSGKELLARAVHNLSHRRDQPFVVVNCGALPESLFESELFGYVKGAFTDAKQDKPGRLALASGGTLFLDEVSELPPASQVKLLRVLQEHEYEPLGSIRTLRANVRVVAATNRRLVDRVSRNLFRDDLYFRIAVVRLALPPLSERREDIPFLVEHFIRQFNAKRGKSISGITEAVLDLLMRHDFPGNIRELQNVIEHGFVLCHDRHIDLHHLPDDIQQTSHGPQPKKQRTTRLKRVEADAIRNALSGMQGHLGKTAQELGISRTTLWRKMKQHGIDPNAFREA
jgi:transcriptional regulator with PAS, ATPase and Fis domain